MKNKSNILTSVMLALSAVFMPSNMRADEEAKKLLEALEAAAPAQRDSSLVYEAEEAAVAEAERFLNRRRLLVPAKYPIADEVSILRFCEWDGDPDMVSLIKHMLTLNLGWCLQTSVLSPDLNICGLRSLDYYCKNTDDRSLAQLNLKNAQALKGLRLGGYFREEQLESLSKVISGTNLESVVLDNCGESFLHLDSIAKNLLNKPYLSRIRLLGPFDVLPLFTAHDMSEKIKVERFPQLDVLDLRNCFLPEDTLERLRKVTDRKIYLPQELKIMCTTPDSLEFTRELVYRGIHLETLSIDYPYINDKIINDKMMETLTAIIEQNRCNSLSAIHFRHIGAINVSQATKEALKKVLLESEIVLDDGFLKELYPEDFHPAKTPQKAKND